MNQDFTKTSYLFGANAIFIDELYQKYLKDPSSIDQSWLEFFQEDGQPTALKTTSKIIGTAPQQSIKNIDSKSSQSDAKISNTLKAKFMITAYRSFGHYLATLDPLNLEIKKTAKELHLTLNDFGFTEDQLSNIIDIPEGFGSLTTCTVQELFDTLNNTYGGNIGVEFAHIESPEEQKWLYNIFEDTKNKSSLSNDDKMQLLQDLTEIEGFEQYLHTKFPGAKRFSIENGDSAIVCLDKIIELSAMSGTADAVLGLAHRGRLSTLAKVMQKPHHAILSEFMGTSSFPDDLDISGDVKYHMGFSSDRIINEHKIHLSLTPNPSHLEAVNPVVAGKVRAKQDLYGRDRNKVIGILIHGDAAFCGQGVVSESLAMSGLKPYEVGGIFHLVINNQIGFTANPSDSRPGRYCTEVAKIISAPIIHVNGDDIESVIVATQIAHEYRIKFNKDIIVDIVCYRKYGHNEGDEPMYTQAMMYNVIKTKQTPAAIYAAQLVDESVIEDAYYSTLKQEFKTHLDNEFNKAKEYKPKAQWLDGNWQGFDTKNTQIIESGVKQSTLKELCNKLCNIKDSFPINKKLTKLFTNRMESINQDLPLDWATAEQLAFASLLNENIPIRITGQDAGRGTFSHRHAVLHSQIDKETYIPLNDISSSQAFLDIADSNLSEYAVLGFEYGYSLVNPKHLVIWEAQFGDFCNGAQIIFDQFISSAETKWLRMSGLVCLLPHGFEGQGPEHSSARLERFLQLCAENNIQVAYPTTPSSIFHLLRKQVLSNVRKPLMIMSPKSLLRHKHAVSPIDEFIEGTSFIPVIDETNTKIAQDKVKKIIFCTGKIYYDLLDSRDSNNIEDIAIIRLEQLYPFEKSMIVDIINKYKNAQEFIWCQEEPKNMGCWQYIKSYIDDALLASKASQSIAFVGRSEAAAPAVGYLYAHNQQQEAIISQALKTN